MDDGKIGGYSKDDSPVWKSNAAAVSVGNIVKDTEGKLAAVSPARLPGSLPAVKIMMPSM